MKLKKKILMIVAMSVMTVMLTAGVAQASSLFGAIQDAVSGVMDGAQDVVGEALDGVKDILGDTAGIVDSALGAAKDTLGDAAGEVADALKEIRGSEESDPNLPDNGEYLIDVSLEGGTGRATILSPCVIRYEEGKATAVIVWSSENYDYMIVDDERIEPITVEGGSTFEIAVEDLETPLEVIADTTAMSKPHEIAYTITFDVSSLKAMDTDVADAEEAAVLEDGEYTAKFDTDSSMFHVNESCDGKGVLTVKDGEMTIHVSLVSRKIVNLFPGLAEDAEKEGAEILEPTLDEVTYSDGWTEEVYGFDIPVPVIGEEFDLAILGTKGTWYDHKVSVSEPEPIEAE